MGCFPPFWLFFSGMGSRAFAFKIFSVSNYIFFRRSAAGCLHSYFLESTIGQNPENAFGRWKLIGHLLGATVVKLDNDCS